MGKELKSRFSKLTAILLVCLVAVQFGAITGASACCLALVARILSEPLPQGDATPESEWQLELADRPKAKKKRHYVINSHELYAA